jgi:glutathione gamma-glutamylcysteinyltransferase
MTTMNPKLPDPLAATFYKRPLPSRCVPFASEEGRSLFQDAMTAGTMAGYFALAEQFHTQADPAFCGLGTLVVVLNALAIDPGPQRPWKGPWRWFTEEHLDCCRPLHEVQRTGLTISQLACLARCNGARVEVQYGQAVTAATFRDAVREAATAAGEPHLVVSYDRATLGQTGSGHYSPVGGYHAGRDLVLILDVARFKYPPHWVPLEDLFHAMLPVDSETGRSRGFLRFWRRCEVASLCYLEATEKTWLAIECEFLQVDSLASGSVEEMLSRLLRVLPAQALSLIRRRTFGDLAPAEVLSAQNALWQELESTEIMRLLRLAHPTTDMDLGTVALLLLVLPAPLFRCLPAPLRERLESLQGVDLLPPVVREQVEYLRSQVEALDELSTCGPIPIDGVGWCGRG